MDDIKDNNVIESDDIEMFGGSAKLSQEEREIVLMRLSPHTRDFSHELGDTI